MEITPDVSIILKCSKCFEILSCGPVYFFLTTFKVTCGRCVSRPRNDNSNTVDLTNNDKETKKIRFIQYEAAASLLLFPCRFERYGCTKKIPFSVDGPNYHESLCKFIPYHCPMTLNSSCHWQNTLEELLEHCKSKHPQQVYENPCNYPPKWNSSSERVFLLTYLDRLFLVHVKVCLERGKIFHLVRLLGDPSLARGLQFVFKAKVNNIEYSKQGSILPTGSLLMDETSAISTEISNLLEILDNKHERSIFTLTINVVMVNCKFCQVETEFTISKICSQCLLKMRKCQRSLEGCTYEDVNKYKCYKHEYYYCKYRTKCSFSFCFKTFPPGHFFQHFIESTCRSVISSRTDVFWHANASNKFCVVDSSIGLILCNYSMKLSKLDLYISTSLASNELNNYQIVVQIQDVFLGRTIKEFAEVVHNNYYDFRLIIGLKDFVSWKKNGLNIKIQTNNI